MLEQIAGKKSVALTPAALREKTASFARVHLDVGCGDGQFVIRLARENPEMLVIGIDADRGKLMEGAVKSARKPARGGAPNAMFFCANVLECPAGFEKLATRVSVNFPWGSLLKSLLLAEAPLLNWLSGLAQPGSVMDWYLNLHVVTVADQRERLELPELDDTYIKNVLTPACAKAGGSFISQHRYAAGEDSGIYSTWGRHLARNSERPTLHLQWKIG